METQYFCTDEERHELAHAAGLNGIDHLEVLDLQSPDGAPRQRTLLVFFLLPLAADIDASQVSVDGGARVTGIGVEWVARNTTAIDPTLISAAEQAYYASLGDDVLIVRTDHYGDHSTYTLVIDDLPSATFDPRLNRQDFSFKAECPHDFDCAPDDECPPVVATEPPIDYLARDYSGFRRIMLDRLSVLLPDWSDRDQAADATNAYIETLAYLGDRLSYYQDAVATEAYLGTAHQRVSMRRHGRLLDYRLHEGANSRVWVHIDVDAPGAVPLLSGTQFLTRLPIETAVIPPPVVTVLPNHPYDEAIALGPVVFEAMHSIIAFEPHNSIDFYTFGDEECCLPKGATRATLKDDSGARLRLMAGDVIVFEQVRDPATLLAADADPNVRHAVRLTKVTPEASKVGNGVVTDRNPGPIVRDALPVGAGQPYVEIEWDERDALPFPFCVSSRVDLELHEDLAVARANVVLADHGRTTDSADAERLEVVRSARPYRPTLDTSAVTFAERYGSELRTEPAALAMAQDVRRALPAITIHDDDGHEWTPVADLLNSDRFARHFVVEPDNERRPGLRFGDDVMGRAPSPGTRLVVIDRIGSGTSGNVGRDTIAHVVGIDEIEHNALAAAVERVRNPLAAVGGTDPEPAEHVRLYAPEAFRTQERAVTEADYAEVAERRRGVQKAAGTRRWTGSWHTMFVTVDRLGGGDVTAETEADLRDHLDRYRLAGQDVEIDAPRFVPLDIAIEVCVEDGFFRSDVKAALLSALSCRRFPDGRVGFFHPDNFTFGDTLHLSTLVAAVMAVEGVRFIDVTRFRRWGREPDNELQAAKIEFGRLEIPQLDNDVNAPENGALELIMEGGR